MASQDFKRKLTAILSADVEGYSLLMRDDEEATIRTLTTYRKAIKNLIQQYRGRLVDATGDNFLSEFASVVDAVNCAVEIQRELAERNAELSENRRMQFRIGINLGDVVEEEGRIYGDGVNIAARMEGLAEGGGICISGKVYEEVKNKLGLEYEYLGEQEVKNITEPVRAYRVLSYPGAAAHRVIKAKKAVGKTWRNVLVAVVAILVVGTAVAIWNFYLRPAPPVEVASVEKMAYPLPDKPSIAVLAFDNLSGDPKQEYLSDGIAEEIITALSKTDRLFVIARNSSFTYKGKPVKVQKVSKDLGVKYVLEGSVKKSRDQVRITAQLIDAIKGHHIWAERYDRDLKDIFAMQDEITMKIMTALRVKLTEGEQARVYGRGTNNLEAYLKVMKGYERVMRFTKDDVHLGRQLYKEAIALDPNYSNAYTLLAWTHRHDVSFGWTKTPEKSIKKGIELVKKALSINEYDALAHMCLSNIYSMMREHEKAIAEGEKGIALEPNGAELNATYAMVLIYAGRYDQAIEKLEKAERLNPISPGWYFWLKTVAFQFAGKYEKAIESAKKGLEKMPNHTSILSNLAASYILLGRMEEASAVTEKILELQPKFSLDQKAKILEHKFKNKADVERHIDALRKAGLPE
ncbi:MAG: tetratricopeptide repeat protein [Desulfobacterales bacterium]|nr:tetratricopeptide repeat protein [Desulfobacterales bacterium]